MIPVGWRLSLFLHFFSYLLTRKFSTKVIKDSMHFQDRDNINPRTQLFSVFTAYRQGTQSLQPGPV